jgi:RNA polymerase sigma factor (sigma-70 family)
LTPSQTIALYRPPLYSLALKLVGSIQDAEDIIQETFLNWLTVDQSKIKNTKAYLTRMVVNKCLNHLKALNQRRQEYIENLRSIELFEKYDFVHLDIAHEIAEALSTLQLKLKPIEKAVFILREVFDFDYEDLQEILNERKDYCRQLLHRAKEKLAVEKPHFNIDIGQHKELVEKFKSACSKGQFSALIDHLLKQKDSF